MKMYLLLLSIMPLTLNSLAADISSQLALKYLQEFTEDIKRMQNFADGYWMSGGNLDSVLDTEYRRQKLSPQIANLFMENVDLVEDYWEGLALYLTRYQYEDSKIVWEKLMQLSSKKNRHKRVFEAAVGVDEDRVVKVQILSIQELFEKMKKEKVAQSNSQGAE